MVDNSYWRNRELEHIEKSIKDDAKIARRLRRLHLQAMDDIESQIEAFYGRYADVEGISMREARRRASKLDVEKYSRKAKGYVKDKNFSREANEQMRIYNVTMQINRLEMLKANIHLELLAMTNEEQKVLFEEMTKGARAEYQRQAGILGESLNFNERNINSVVNASFLNATWSDRLWDNQDALRSELDRLLNRGIVQGRNPRELAREFRKSFDTSVFNSERLLITETARVQQDVFQDSMRQAEIEEYEYIAEPTACEVCSALDGEVFKVEDAEPGINAYPMHPFCKCSQAAYIDREAWEREMDERGLTDGESNGDIKSIVDEASAEILANDAAKRIQDEEEVVKDEISKLKEELTAFNKEKAQRTAELRWSYEDGDITATEYNEGVEKIDEWFKNSGAGKINNKIRNLTSGMVDLRENIVYDNAKHVKNVLSRYRDMGIDDVDMKGHFTNPRAAVSKQLLEAYDYYPTDWVKNSVESGTITSKATARGHYIHSNRGASVISVSGGGSSGFKTSLHELAHRQEYINPAILEAEKLFYEKRTKGEALQKLRDVTGNRILRDNEMTRVDEFLNPYMGKDYKGEAYELLTMGLDTLYTNPKELAKDPEMFNWVIEVLLTK